MRHPGFVSSRFPGYVESCVRPWASYFRPTSGSGTSYAVCRSLITALVEFIAVTCLNTLHGTSWPRRCVIRDSPDESQTGINVRVFPALLQDRREVLTATSTSDNPNAWSRV